MFSVGARYKRIEMARVSQRATRNDIFTHLDRLLGAEAKNVVVGATHLVLTGNNEQALEILKTFDILVGGIGLHSLEPQTKLPGPYRSISYVYMALSATDVEARGRSIAEFAVVNVESILKKMVRLGFFERMRDNVPMGSVLRKIEHRIPKPLFEDLAWLNDEVYVFAKHKYDFSDDDGPDPEHYFELDEAIAVYFIARKLVVELSKGVDPATVQAWATYKYP